MNHLIKKSLMAVGITMAMSSVSMADDWAVKITNLTHGNHFTPLFVAAHDDNKLYEVGSTASSAMRIMAECGATTDLDAALLVLDSAAVNVNNPASGVLAPGVSATSDFTNPAGSYLTVLAMMLPTNDAFIGLNSQHIPAYDTTAGASNTHVFLINGYDAGTEANDELLATADCAAGVAGYPAAPGGATYAGGANGTGAATTDANTKIHTHRGVLGDTSATAGVSDLDSTIHRWQNPVARVIVTVTQ